MPRIRVYDYSNNSVYLDLDEGSTDYTAVANNLFDLPARPPKISSGYQSSPQFAGSTMEQRNFTVTIRIERGLETWPLESWDYLDARDQLIAHFPEQELVTLEFGLHGSGGTTEYWRIDAYVLGLTQTPGTAQFEAELTAPDPRFYSSATFTLSTSLPDGASPTRDVVLNVGGNAYASPIITITPHTPKVNRWKYRRVYHVTNNRDTLLRGYPVALDLNFGALISAGKLRSNAGDLLVRVDGGEFQDRWWSFPVASATKVWCQVDLPASGTIDIEVTYGYPLIDPSEQYVNQTDGPMFRLEYSSNAVWTYLGRFMDPPGRPTTHSWQWARHAAESYGMVPITHSVAPPWEQYDQFSVNVAGGEIPQSVDMQGYAGAALHHPLGIESVQHSGRSRQNPLTEKLVLRARNEADGALNDVWQLLTDTSAAEAAYGPLLYSFGAGTTEAIVFALRSLTKHVGIAGHIAAADNVAIAIEDEPTVVAEAEEPIYMLEFTLTHLDLGDTLKIFGTVPPDIDNPPDYLPVVLDLEKKTLTAGGNPFVAALVLQQPINAELFRLRRGTNNVRVRDEDAQDVDIAFAWRNRRF